MRRSYLGWLALIATLGSPVYAAQYDELGYSDPMPPLIVDLTPVQQREAVLFAHPEDAALSIHERCLKRAETALFDEKLMCATQSSMNPKIRSAGAIPLAPSQQKNVFQYDVRHLWPGSLYVSVAFAGERFAVADVAYLDTSAGFERLYQNLFQQFGQPRRIEGRKSGVKGIMWQRDDGIQVWLHRPKKGVLLVSYIRPDMYQYWLRPVTEVR